MRLELIEEINPDSWDEAIERFDSKFLFHQSAWLNFLEESQGGRVVRFRILDDERLAGYFVGLLVKKGPLKILGSPLPGWTTNFMGPIVNKGFDSQQFSTAMDDMCANWGIHHVELCNPVLNTAIMRRSGFGVSEGMTFMVPLSADEDQMWGNLKSNCRNRIRKALKNGLVVDDRDDPAFADEYFEQLKEVFDKQGLVPTYSLERVKSLLRHLRLRYLFALSIKYEDATIATAIFPHDNRCVYFFGGASWKSFQHLCPNELLHWAAMTRAAQIGIREYNMCGSGSFKPKFGGEETSVYRFKKSYSNFVRLGREAYKALFAINQRLRGRHILPFN